MENISMHTKKKINGLGLNNKYYDNYNIYKADEKTLKIEKNKLLYDII